MKVDTTLLPTESNPVLDAYDQLRVMGSGVSLSASRRYVVASVTRMGDAHTASGYFPVTESGAPETYQGSRLSVIDVETGAETVVPGTGTTAWCPRWSPTEDQLVFYSDAGGRGRPWLWRFGDAESQLAADVEILVIDGAYEGATWSADGTKLFVPARRTSLADDLAAAAARPLHYLQSEALLGEAVDSPLAGGDVYDAPADLAVIDVAAGQVTARSSGIDVAAVFPSPAGEWVAVATSVRRPDILTVALEASLHILSASSLEPVSQPMTVAANKGFAPAWSPDGKTLAWTAVGGDLFRLRPTQDTTPQRIDTGVPVGPATPLWHPTDGGRLLAIATDGAPTLFELGDSVTANARRLTLPDNGLLERLPSWGGALAGRERALILGTVTVFRSSAGNTFAVTGADEAIVLFATETGGSLGCYLPLDGGQPQVAEPPMTTVKAEGFTDAGEGLFVFAGEEFDKPPVLWVSRAGLDEAQLLWDPNPTVQRGSWGSRQLVSWTDPEGQPVQGALYLPPVPHETPPPLVWHVYPGWEASRSADAFHSTIGPPIPWHVLTGHGFAVFMPDLPLYPGYTFTMEPRVTQNALLAFEALARTGLVDAARAGVMGTSGGACQTMSFICQTSRFKAAVAVAGISDGVSAYGHIMYGPGEPSFTAWASVNGGASPSADPQVYIRTSPVFHLKDVTTPLLLMHAANDSVPEANSGEMFVGLRQLGKKVAYARYSEGGHGPGQWPARRDACQRIIGWFQRFLVDEASDD